MKKVKFNFAGHLSHKKTQIFYRIFTKVSLIWPILSFRNPLHEILTLPFSRRHWPVRRHYASPCNDFTVQQGWSTDSIEHSAIFGPDATKQSTAGDYRTLETCLQLGYWGTSDFIMHLRPPQSNLYHAPGIGLTKNEASKSIFVRLSVDFCQSL